MKLPRRDLLHLAVGAAALPAVSRIARAQAYPVRPLRWTIGFTAGGTADGVARTIGQWLSERLGQPVIIESKPGGGTNVSAQAVIGSPPDGYSLLLATSANAVNATFYDNLPFNFLRDIVPVASLISFPLILVVNPSVPATTVAEFIAYAKANPGKLSFASVGAGTTTHLTGELFKTMTGINIIHVPYRGSAPATTDLISGQVQVVFAAVDVLPHVQSGTIRALGITSAVRSSVAPNLPPIGDTVPGFEAIVWYGVGVRTGTRDEIIERLSREINAGLATPNIQARLTELGTTPMILTRADFGKLIASETEKWGKVVKTAGIKSE
jgi:tripartite-type tricarboxylate transporter receptor subunit TctC